MLIIKQQPRENSNSILLGICRGIAYYTYGTASVTLYERGQVKGQ